MIHKVIDVVLENQEVDTPAKLYTYVIDNSKSMDEKRVRPAVIICPGGGYEHTSDREAEPIAIQYLAGGVHAFILRYHVAPYEYPISLLELAKSVQIVREHAKEWNIDPDAIMVSGFSAGAHLAGCLAMFWKKKEIAALIGTSKDMIRPNGCILCYPVITSGQSAHRGSFVKLLGERYDELHEELSLENQVSSDTPPMFIWHTFSDDAVPVENSLLLVSALRKNDISTEFHMYCIGKHGLGLANEETSTLTGREIQPECQNWIDMAIRWTKRNATDHRFV